MTPERWQQVKALLENALECAEAERAAYLDGACEGDGELRSEVESFLALEDEASDFIETPVFNIHSDDGFPLAEGQRIGAYRIVREIGRGGMGSVYLAERADEEFDKRVALKLIRRGMDTDEIVRRFRSERQILAHLDHDNIAKLLDGGTTEDGRPYLVMEYVEGQPLHVYCDGRKLSIRERLQLFRKVCSAVHFAHQRLIVHRDLKPGNILVTEEGVPKLLDFGIAKLLDSDQPLLTRLEQRPMTPEYASPEQVRGEAITTASDVYSLGVLLYGLLTGHAPYRPSTRDPLSLSEAIRNETPPRPSTIIGQVEEVKKADGSTVKLTPESVSEVRNSEIGALRRELAGDLDNIVLMAMNKEPERRYSSVDQFSNDIDRYLHGLPVIARKSTLRYRAAKFVRRNKLGVTVAALVLLMILGFSVTVTAFWQRAVRERTLAESALGFLQDLFEGTDPSLAKGEEITAREMLDQGLVTVEESLKNQPELQATMMDTIGRVYRSLGHYEQARRLLERALELRRRTLGPQAPEVAHSLNNLSNLVHDMDGPAEAEPLIREALHILDESGMTHDLVYAKGLTNLAAILEKQEKFDEAEELLNKSIALKRKHPDAAGADMARSLNLLGSIHQSRGDLATAEQLYRETLAIRKRIYRDIHPEVATALSNLATVLEERGKVGEAESLLRVALEMRRKLYGDKSPEVARTLSNLGFVLQSQGKNAAAEPLYREALSIADEKLRKTHPHRAAFLRNHASALVHLGKAKEAEAEVREALEIFRSPKAPAWRVPDAETVLGASLAAQGRFEEAEPLLINGYSKLLQEEGDGAKYAEAARQRVHDLYTAWDKPEKAAQYAEPRPLN